MARKSQKSTTLHLTIDGKKYTLNWSEYIASHNFKLKKEQELLDI
jgi:hypothetical protein